MTDADLSAIREDIAATIERLRAIEARLDGQGGKAAADDAAGPAEWPPDPQTINLHDGTWLLIKDAMHDARCSEVTIRRRIASENIAVQIGGVWWVNRARLLSGRRYPKAPDQI